jgi:hypothetical protein
VDRSTTFSTFLKEPCDITTAVIKDDIERVCEAIADLCEPLHDTFRWADETRRPELAEEPEYRWHATHTIRAYAHYRLGRTGLGAWRLSGNHAQNGALWLSDGDYRVRVLHEPSEDKVPPAGHNGRRRAYYRNTPLEDLPQPLFGPPDDRLLVLWRINPESSSPIFRVVRPIGNWKFGTHAMTDLDFELPESADLLADLEFEPTDEGLELDIPEEQEGGSTDAGGVTG